MFTTTVIALTSFIIALVVTPLIAAIWYLLGTPIEIDKGRLKSYAWFLGVILATAAMVYGIQDGFTMSLLTDALARWSGYMAGLIVFSATVRVYDIAPTGS
ncbi:hypothetical protein EOL96_03355 [Candidatus Saccharibacteria bacterium]|nr:hypothetical protein [Candidatus Saccharibacteria bacterium]